MQGMKPSTHHNIGALAMPTVKLGAKRQITIPAEITNAQRL
jgi:hypothetical protein